MAGPLIVFIRCPFSENPHHHTRYGHGTGADDATRKMQSQYLVGPVDRQFSFFYSWLVRPDRVDEHDERATATFLGDKEIT
jgi:hypothetical protein